MKHLLVVTTLLLALPLANTALTQEVEPPTGNSAEKSSAQSEEKPAPKADEPTSTDGSEESLKEKVADVAETLNNDSRAQTAAAGILKPIYELAERFSFSSFHWIAFALMATGVVSFTLQLVIGKLLLIARMEFDLGELLSDTLGLAISVIGLVLTTQAAAENSKFTQNAALVLSATAVGLVLGFIFFRIGFGSEARAAKVRK